MPAEAEGRQPLVRIRRQPAAMTSSRLPKGSATRSKARWKVTRPDGDALGSPRHRVLHLTGHPIDFPVRVDKITGSTADQHDHGNRDACEDLVKHQRIGSEAMLVRAGTHLEAPGSALLGGHGFVHGRDAGFNDDGGGVHPCPILTEASIPCVDRFCFP